MDPHPLATLLARNLSEMMRQIDSDLGSSRDPILTPQNLVASFSTPPKVELGDLSFPCFPLAKVLRKSPAQIAKELAQAFSDKRPDFIDQVSNTGPYLNFKFNLAHAAQHVAIPWAREKVPEYASSGQHVMIEYSQPNTHKAFHVGHMRNLCLGDSLVHLLRATGQEVVAANYLGDVGTHIAKCLWGFERLSSAEQSPPQEGKGEWLGNIYVKSAIELEELENQAKSDPQAKEKHEQARARMTEILHGIEQQDEKIYPLWQKTRQWSLEEFDEIYRWCGVEFDRLFFESEVDRSSLALVDEYLAKGTFVISEGAVGIFNEEIKHMPFFMLRKGDGTGLYSTKDLALARLKFENFNIDRSIYVVDVRQSDHFRHVFLTLKKMGFPQAEHCEHVPYEMVELPTGAMAGRTGNVILFRSLREQMIEALVRDYFSKYRGEWEESEIMDTAHQVALGAIKYGMLARDVNQKIIFDMPAWLKFEGNTGPYLQYVCARTASILRKAAANGKTIAPQWLDDNTKAEDSIQMLSALNTTSERGLLLQLAGLGTVVEQAAKQLRPAPLCTYLFQLCKAYNRFQDECHVMQSEGELLQARLLLVQATRNALRWGLGLLGIPAIERM